MTALTLDLDDFCDENTDFSMLQLLREKHPEFRVTLFTIVGQTSFEYLERMWDIPWIELIPHGWTHNTSRECEEWSYKRSVLYLKLCEEIGYVKGFKAPGWNISDGMYNALLERGWWVADHPKNAERRPKYLRVYDWTTQPGAVHGHIGQWRGHNDNSLSYLLPELLKMYQDTEWKFISEVL